MVLVFRRSSGHHGDRVFAPTIKAKNLLYFHTKLDGYNAKDVYSSSNKKDSSAARASQRIFSLFPFKSSTSYSHTSFASYLSNLYFYCHSCALSPAH
jgi:hypothetical protein